MRKQITQTIVLLLIALPAVLCAGGTGFPSIDASTQFARDNSRASILLEEIANEKTLLLVAQQKKDARLIQTHASNIEALNKEIARAKGVKVAYSPAALKKPKTNIKATPIQMQQEEKKSVQQAVAVTPQAQISSADIALMQLDLAKTDENTAVDNEKNILAMLFNYVINQENKTKETKKTASWDTFANQGSSGVISGVEINQ